MRELDKIANEYYDGDTKKAIKGFFLKQQCISNYIDEFTPEEAEFAFSLVLEDMAKQYGGKEKLGKKWARSMTLEQLDLTEKEVLEAEENPYKTDVLKAFLKLLLAEAGVIILSLIGNFDKTFLGLAFSSVTTIFSMNLAGGIMRYFQFKKIKKQLKKEQQQN